MGNIYKAISAFFVVFLSICDRNVNSSSNKRATGWENVFSTNFTTALQLQHFGNKTYYLGIHMKASYFQAMQICQSVHMSLVTVESLEENERLFKYVRETNKGDEFWSSGSKLLDAKHWKWMSNGKNVEYTKWATGQPDSQVEHCLLLVHQRNVGLFWHDRDCNGQFWFICERRDEERDSGIPNSMTIWNNLFVNPMIWSNMDLLQFDNKSYYFSRQFKGTFLQANQFCEMIGMSLLTIRSPQENQRLHKYIRDTNAGVDWWCSGTRFIDGRSWIWTSTGEQVDYTNWLTGQPDNINHYCLHLTDQKNTDLFWNDQDCNVQYQVICEKWHNFVKPKVLDIGENQMSDGSDESNRHNKAHRDSDWREELRRTSPGYIEFTHIEGRRFHIQSEMEVSQKEAAQFCEYHKMQLLSIEDEKKNKLIERLLADTSVIGPYWTSGKKSGGVWIWYSTGETLSFFNWSPFSNAENNCIGIDDRGKWIKHNCQQDSMKFICELPGVAPMSQCPAQPVVNVYVQNEVVTASEKKVSDIYRRFDNVTAQ